jgi:hypothetical protein
MTKKQDLIFAISFFLLGLIFCLLKTYSPQIIESLYQSKSFELLNKLSHSQGTQSLDYYQGETEIVLFGPLKSLISGFLFLIFSLFYLRNSSHFRFGLAVFIYFLLTRPEILLNPPFGEGITGPFSDAIWLLQHNLDYMGLLHQDTVMTGGPQIYPTALYPLFLAVLMKLIPSTTGFLVVMHLLIFAMAATIVSLLRRSVQNMIENKEFAILTAILLLFLPLFQSMSELINLEIPLLFFAMLTVYYLSKNNTAAACFCALGSLFVKDPGIITCGVVVVFSIKRFLKEQSTKNRWKIFGWNFVMMAIVIGKSVLRQILLGAQQRVYKPCVLCGWVMMKIEPWFWIYSLTLLIFLIQFIRKKDRRDETMLMFTMAGFWYFMFTNFSTLAYRHQLLVLPFLVFCISYALHTLIKKKLFLEGFLTGCVFVALLSSHGWIYFGQRLTTFYPTHLERSLEYRNYLLLEKRLAKEMEQNFAERPIVSPFQTAQLLAIPELGYVNKKLDVTVYGMRATLGIKPYHGLKELNNPIFVGFPHQVEHTPYFDFPIDKGDKIVEKLQVGHLEVDIFEGGAGIERMRLIIMELLSRKNSR